jgi:hypothetical protein
MEAVLEEKRRRGEEEKRRRGEEEKRRRREDGSVHAAAQQATREPLT